LVHHETESHHLRAGQVEATGRAHRQRPQQGDFMDTPTLTTFLDVVGFIVIAAFLVLALAVFVWVFADVFRRSDVSGVGKVGWVLLILVFPLFGALIYIATRPRASGDDDPVISWAPAKGAMSPTDELAYAHGLLQQGTITQEQFDEVKRNLGF
jgi:hypothetical protein